jgi:molybdenum-dependent DNA-binding transcriptional regulator ModE
MKPKRMEAKSKVWIEVGGEVVAGDGKINLLERIEETGSIQKAAGEIGMSYRHAWLPAEDGDAGRDQAGGHPDRRKGRGRSETDPPGKGFLAEVLDFS